MADGNKSTCDHFTSFVCCESSTVLRIGVIFIEWLIAFNAKLMTERNSLSAVNIFWQICTNIVVEYGAFLITFVSKVL